MSKEDIWASKIPVGCKYYPYITPSTIKVQVACRPDFATKTIEVAPKKDTAETWEWQIKDTRLILYLWLNQIPSEALHIEPNAQVLAPKIRKK